MADTNIKIIDEAVKVLLFERYKDEMEIDNLNTDTAFFPKDVALRIIGEKRAEVGLEFINVWRTATRRNLSRERTPLARKGLPLQYTDPSGKTDIEYAKAMPVDLDYSAWFWSKDKDKLNRVIEEFIFWKHQDPNVNLYYESLFPVEYDMLFGDVIDESPVEEMYNIGMYFVIRLDFTVQGWVFDSDTIKTVHKVFLKIYDDVDPGGPLERSVLLFEAEYDLTQ